MPEPRKPEQFSWLLENRDFTGVVFLILRPSSHQGGTYVPGLPDSRLQMESHMTKLSKSMKNVLHIESKLVRNNARLGTFSVIFSCVCCGILIFDLFIYFDIENRGVHWPLMSHL